MSNGNGFYKIVFFGALWVGAFLTSLSVVYCTYSVRQSTQGLEVLRQEQERLLVISGQYLLEKSSYAEYSRVESEAKKKLKMVEPDPSNIVLVYRK